MAADLRCAHCDRPVKDGLTLCATCGDALVEALLAVPELVLDIEITRARLDRTQNAHTAGRSAEAALPVRATRYGATMIGDQPLNALHNTVTTWARAVAEDLAVSPHIGGAWLVHLTEQHRGDTPRDGATLPLVALGHLEQAAVWLAQHRNTLRAYEAALELLHDVTAAVDRLRAMTDHRPELRYLGPCPDCSAELRAERGASWVRCRACRTQHEIARIEAEARAAAENRLFTLVELLRVLGALGAPVAKRTLYRWAGEHKFEARGWSHTTADGRVRITDHRVSDGDKRVYRLGDVLAVAHHEHEQGGSAA
ncbi:hypothetical protein [Nocardia otitidiscaviarum]|uniref:hypothetical protein n=1 Tax=Nocardia otitidiscaviarum TaxID=1823 RepID=UPI0011DDD5FF|nr:hypothetical protein [Nocardia otitidiscaviarum]